MKKVDQANIGKRVTIRAVSTPELNNRAALIGQQGEIIRAIKSRNVYRLSLDRGGYWDALPDNVEVQP